MRNDTRTEEEKQQARNNSLANLKLFKKPEDLTPEEQEKQRQILVAGGKARVEQRRQQKSMNEQAKMLLDRLITTEQAEIILGPDAKLLEGCELTLAQVLNARMVQEAAAGSTRAYEAIRDTAGYSPKKEVDITADLMTDADRELIAKISGRIG